MNFDYKDITEKNNGINDKLIEENKVIISIITPFYNAKKYLEDTAKCIINQTFPYFEWIIVDDGSTDKESLEYLEKIGKMDSRIKILHKENSGQADTRDYGVKMSNAESKYVIFIDDDDIIDNTYLECGYWTLETNKDASWAYTDVIHFGELNALATARFDPEREKKENNIVVTALIRKADFLKVGGFGLKEKGVYEDWNLWLKMIAAKMFPVRMGFFGFWYRRKKAKYSELAKSKDNEVKAKKIIEETVKTIKETRQPIQYPRSDYNWDLIEEKVDGIVVPKYEDNKKIKILMIIPWMIIGGADKFNIDLINGLNPEKYEVTVISTEPKFNVWREKYQKNTKAIYDLSAFLDRKNWLAFINYIIEKNNINIVLNTNSTFGYSILPYVKAKYPKIPVIDYIHMEEWYNRNGGFARDSSAVASVIDKTLVCNEGTKRILVNHFGREDSEVETVYIGVDENKFTPDLNKEELKAKYMIPKEKKVIGFIARIDLQKRPILLMEIIKKLKVKRNDFIVLVAGAGPMLDRVKEISKEYKIDKNIRFLGAVSNTKEIYSMSDITLNCSIKEGLALTAYESLSMGVPVVTADVGGQAELVDETVGAVVPCIQGEKDVTVFKYSDKEIDSYVDAIEKVFGNLDYYKSNARQRILDGFTINHMIKRMSEIFTELSEKPSETKRLNGVSLGNCIDICKELNSKYMVCFEKEYEWQAEEFERETDIGVSKINSECNENVRQSSTSIFGKIRQKGKRAFIKEIAIKLHVYHEICLIMEIVENIYTIFRFFIQSIIKLICIEIGLICKIIIAILKLFMIICVRVINIFAKLLFKKSIKTPFNKDIY